MATRTVLLASSRPAESLRLALLRAGFKVESAHPSHAIEGSVGGGVSVAIVACDAGEDDEAIAAARALRAGDVRLPIVFIAERSCEALAIAALKAGATDYHRGPVDATCVAASVCAAAHVLQERPCARTALRHEIIGTSAAMCHVRAYLETVGATDANVLITGETGTGKELAAQLLHSYSSRRTRPFVSINCAAIPDGLLESELFGYERGAFTGAAASREGYFRAAEGGTVLLDEIGEMTPFAQAKILRALDTREVYRLGSTRKLPLNIRVIAATNQDLDGLIEDGRFRKDLYYRLNVARVRLPPLRERREDIPALLDHYIGELNVRFQRSVAGFTDESMLDLVAYEWPGNVREIKNMLEGVFAEMPRRPITFIDAPAALRERVRRRKSAEPSERDRLLAALRATNWNKSLAAEQLHWSRMTLYRKLAKYDVKLAKG